MDASTVAPTVASPTSQIPEVKQHVDSLSPQQLEARRREIVDSARGDYENLSTEMLQELSYISSTLRRRTAGPPKTPRVAGSKPKPTIADLI